MYIVLGIIAVIAIIIILFVFLGNSNKIPQSEIDTFAKCLTEKGTLMYGTFWCPKCAQQKKMFGSSFQYIKSIECDPRGENEQSELCIEKGVEKYPDWEFPDGSREVGILSFEELGQKSGCAAPRS